MSLLASHPNNQRHGRTGAGAQPNPVREGEGKASHLFHVTRTQPMHAALTHSNRQLRNACTDKPKSFRAGAANATALPSVMKMTSSHGPKPIREMGGEAGHLFCATS
jgi:hypothetical protein